MSFVVFRDIVNKIVKPITQLEHVNHLFFITFAPTVQRFHFVFSDTYDDPYGNRREVVSKFAFRNKYKLSEAQIESLERRHLSTPKLSC